VTQGALPTRPYRAILVEQRGDAAWLTLNRPERRNAIGPQMVSELLYALDDALTTESIRVVVITGAGRGFSAGGDFAQMTSGADSGELPPRGGYEDLLLALVRADKPVIARVNGHAMGGGLGLVAASTFAVATSEAKLGTPEVDVGLFPFMIYAVLERVMERRRLVRMMLLGERLDAEEARRAGLVDEVVPPEALDEAVEALVAKIASKSPMTLRLGMRALTEVEGRSLEEKLPLLAQRLFECLATEDAREGLAAFVEKRPPRWTGR
jgi:enoyl-CoA hydratase/carnithine racemase